MTKKNKMDARAPRSRPAPRHMRRSRGHLAGFKTSLKYRRPRASSLSVPPPPPRIRSADLHAGANKVTGAIEEALARALKGMAEVNRKVVEVAHLYAEKRLSAIYKLADAQSLTEAYEVMPTICASRATSLLPWREERGEVRQRQGVGGLRRPARRYHEDHAGTAPAGRLIGDTPAAYLGARAGAHVVSETSRKISAKSVAELSTITCTQNPCSII